MRRSMQRRGARALTCLVVAAALLPSAAGRELRATASAADREQVRSSGWGFEVVVARSYEDLAWLSAVPASYHVTIYNKGGEQHPMPQPPEGREWSVVDLPNLGRESHTFAEHLVRRYDSLAGYTIFTQGDPFTHNEHYLELLNSPALLGTVQTMSTVYKSFHTPTKSFDRGGRHPWYRSDRLSLRTLNSVWFHDEGTVLMQKEYREWHKLAPGANLIRHMFQQIGLPGWIPKDMEVGSFSYGAQIGFERSRALQHPKRVYEQLIEASKTDINGWIIERIWLMLLGGPQFRDV